MRSAPIRVSALVITIGVVAAAIAAAGTGRTQTPAAPFEQPPADDQKPIIATTQPQPAAPAPTGKPTPAALTRTATKRPLDAIPKSTRDAIGVDGMSESQKSALEGLLVSLADSGAAARTAQAYLRNKGFEMVTVSRVQRARLDEFDIERKWIVVRTDLGSKYAVEPPALWIEPAGQYWGKPAVFGGVETLIDSAGEEHDLAFSKRKRLD